MGALMRAWRQPVVVTSPLDVFDLNKRAVLLLASPHFGRVAYIVIGALQVGSIRLSVSPGDRLAKVQSILACPCFMTVVFRGHCMHACMLPGPWDSPMHACMAHMPPEIVCLCMLADMQAC
jgi:hypothetical protein